MKTSKNVVKKVTTVTNAISYTILQCLTFKSDFPQNIIIIILGVTRHLKSDYTKMKLHLTGEFQKVTNLKSSSWSLTNQTGERCSISLIPPSFNFQRKMMRSPRMRCTLTEHTDVFPEALVSLLAFPSFLSLSRCLFSTLPSLHLCPLAGFLCISSLWWLFSDTVASPLHSGVVALLCVCASVWDVRIWAWSLLLHLCDWFCLVLSRHMSLGHPQTHTHKFQSSILPPTLLSHMYSNPYVFSLFLSAHFQSSVPQIWEFYNKHTLTALRGWIIVILLVWFV